MKRILGNVLGYGVIGIVYLSVITLTALLIGLICWITLIIWSHVFAFFM